MAERKKTPRTSRKTTQKTGAKSKGASLEPVKTTKKAQPKGLHTNDTALAKVKKAAKGSGKRTRSRSKK